MTVDVDDAERTLCRAKNAEHVPTADIDERRGKLACVSHHIVVAANDAQKGAALSRVELLVTRFHDVAFVDMESRFDAMRAIDRRIDRAPKTERTAHRFQESCDDERRLSNARDLAVRFENGTREVALVT
jgi:hypothetical protein